MAKADNLFEGGSNCHSEKYLLFHAKQNVSSPFQSTQLLSLAQISFFYVGQAEKILKNLFMLSVRISSYGCTWEVWRARKMRKSCTRR